MRSLWSLGIEATSYGALLAPVLLAKLPPNLQLIVSKKISDSNLDIDALLATIEEEPYLSTVTGLHDYIMITS